MKNTTGPLSAVLVGALIAALPVVAQTPSAISKMYESQLKMIDSEVVALAEAMPADKYDFVPAKGAFEKVRTFGEQVTHIAETIYEVSAPMQGEEMPAEAKAKPDKSKEQIVKYLKASMLYAHKAVAGITDANAMEPVANPFGKNKTTRLYLASVPIWHSFDHYGQMVVYARMNGVVPPASKN
jgi:uncharacterized damage-inducible protein DinB